MQAEELKSKLTLEEVRRSFDEWRGTRSKGGPIPERSWQLTRQLKSGYQLSHIYTSLGISSAQFHRYVMSVSKKASASSDNKKSQPAAFVELPETTLANITQPQALPASPSPARKTVSIKRQDGTCLTLTDLAQNEIKQTPELFLR